MERRWEEELGVHAAGQLGLRDQYLEEFGGFGVGPVAVPVRAVPCACPNCGQPNYKLMRNNHIQCWACTRHFCALCRTVMQRKGGTHFGPGGCRQHS